MAVLNQVLQERYRIIRPIAEGGMGAVYEATDQRLGVNLALKESFFSQESLLQAFHREASMLAMLRHRGLPKVIDHFTEGDRQYLVMEMIPGDDLLKILGLLKRPFPLADVMKWADQLLETLAYLHSQQPPIIHRDIKPANLKLDDRGQIMLLDFGLAKEAALDSGPAGQSLRAYSLNYAPIEQIKGTGTDRRSDIYSAAATVYHLITGVVPVDTLTRANALLEGRSDPLAAAHTLNPAIPPTVSAALEQALMLDRNRRPENAQAMREMLRQAASFAAPSPSAVVAPPPIRTIPISTPPPAVPSAPTATGMTIKSRPMVWIMGAAALALIGVVATASYLIGSYRSRTVESSTQLNAAGSPLPVNPADPNAGLDPDKPIPLTNREFYGRIADTNRIYSFVAQPGLLKFTADTVGADIRVEPLNSEKKEIEFDEHESLSVSTSGGSKVEEGIAQMKVDREQTILLRLKTIRKDDLKAFRLRIDGPARLDDQKSSSPLAAIFTDRLNAAQLNSDTIYGARGGKNQQYYVLTAGPGDLAVQLNIIGSGSIVGVDFEKYIDHDNLRIVRPPYKLGDRLSFGEGIKMLLFKDDYGSVSGGFGEVNDEKNLRLELKKQMKLLMYVSIGNPDLLQAYRVKLGGPIQWAQPLQPPISSGGNIDNLKALFAPRDNPRPLTNGVISGKDPEKESYYSFTAGPGKVNVTLDFEGTNGELKVEFFGPDIKPVDYRPQGIELRLSEYGKTVKREKSLTLTLSREQQVLMRLASDILSGGVRYRVKLDGPVKAQ